MKIKKKSVNIYEMNIKEIKIKIENNNSFIPKDIDKRLDFYFEIFNSNIPEI